MNHHVHTHTWNGTTDRTSKLLISFNVHYVYLGGDNNQSNSSKCAIGLVG